MKHIPVLFRLFGSFLVVAGVVALNSCSDGSRKDSARIIILTGAKSHPPGKHEYIKTARLLKTMLEQAEDPAGLEVDVVYGGWPQDVAVLDSADLILALSDGRDGLETAIPFMLSDERMAVIEKQVNRGCGLMTFHYTTFAPDRYGEQMLAWTGGYFDWLDDAGEDNWYSDITTITAGISLPRPDHPVCRGVDAFEYEEEFYFDIRFRDDDPRLVSLVEVPVLETRQKLGKTVAWAVEREDGGRGFGTTMGHEYDAFRLPGFRKFMLNALVWAAGLKVPEQGVEVPFYEDDEVTAYLFDASLKGLILTGHHHPGHKWEETTPVIRQAIENGPGHVGETQMGGHSGTDEQEMSPRIHLDVSTNIEDLRQYTLEDYDFLVLNYCNWEQPEGLSEASRKAFLSYLEQGGGLIIIHFSNGAWHHALPGAEASDWPAYRDICLRVWDHSAGSTHDPYGTFTVNISDHDHYITRGIDDFVTTDELYYNQVGSEPITPLMTARSKESGRDEPQAWVHTYGSGRVFQVLPGHDAASFSPPEFQEILYRAAVWASGQN